MNTRNYKVTCLACGQSEVFKVDDANHVFLEGTKKIRTLFKSFRWRGDQQWGFACFCGNDNRIAATEEDDFHNLVDGDPITVQKIADSMKIPDVKQFMMEPV